MNKHVPRRNGWASFSVECGSKLNREDQFGKLITRFVPDQTRPTVSQLSDFVQASLLPEPVLDTFSGRMSQSGSVAGKPNENQIILARNHFPRDTGLKLFASHSRFAKSQFMVYQPNC